MEFKCVSTDGYVISKRKLLSSDFSSVIQIEF